MQAGGGVAWTRSRGWSMASTTRRTTRATAWPRRLLLTALDPSTVEDAALYPCHPLAQWDVEDGRLSCAVYQRSCDLFLGAPFSVASYALLTHLLAATTGLRPGVLTMFLGNAHVYANHVDQVREMLRREPMAPPRLVMPAGGRHDCQSAARLPPHGHGPPARPR